MIAQYIHDNKGELSGMPEGYCEAILKPYNKWEYAHIFGISKAVASGSDVAPIRLRVRADNQRLRRTIRKMLAPVVAPVVVEKKNFITKIKKWSR